MTGMDESHKILRLVAKTFIVKKKTLIKFKLFNTLPCVNFFFYSIYDTSFR